jgi:hypothetical protein
MAVALRTITRIQDCDDAPTLGASQNGYALTWDNASGAFVASQIGSVGGKIFLSGTQMLYNAQVANGYTGSFVAGNGGQNLSRSSGTQAYYNTFVGIDAGFYSTTAEWNTVVGFQSLFQNTTGNSNTAVGARALYSNTTGGINTVIGREALYSNTTGGSNSAFGYAALNKNTFGGFNMAIGRQAMYENLTGTHNSAIGYQSLYYNTSGNYNLAIGTSALLANTTGSNNVGLGWEAGRYQANGSTALQTAANSIYIGTQCRGFNNGDTNAIVIGYQAIGQGANTTVIGNTSTVLTAFPGGALQLTEMTAPSAPSANNARVYAEDDGTGKTRLMVRFATGAAQQLAIES